MTLSKEKRMFDVLFTESTNSTRSQGYRNFSQNWDSIAINTQRCQISMEFLGATKFDRAVIDLSLIHLCNQESNVGKEMQQRYRDRQEASAEAVLNPWFDLHWFTIAFPIQSNSMRICPWKPS